MLLVDEVRGNTGYEAGRVETRDTLAPPHRAVLVDANRRDDAAAPSTARRGGYS